MKSRTQAVVSAFGLRVWGGSVETPYPAHQHNEIELNMMEAGYFTYIFAGREITITGGHLCMFWGAIPHQVIRSAPMTRLHWATIPLEYLLHWQLPQSSLQALLTGTFFRSEAVLYDPRFFQQWAQDLAAGDTALALMEIKALIFRLAQSHPISEGYTDVGSERASRMAQYMSRHFADPITVNEVAAVVGLHPNYAMTVFKQAMGLSLIDYLTRQRIAHAQQRLILTDDTISLIALDSGFPSLSHFYISFERICGVSPGHYRRSLRA